MEGAPFLYPAETPKEKYEETTVMSNYARRYHDDTEAALERKLQRPERIYAYRRFA